MPGSGKSTIGRRLAKALGVAMLDTDAVIEETTGRTIADIFANDGEKEFRRIEEEVIREALASHDGVLSLGGGAITSPGVREALSGHTVVYLEISAAEGVRRTGGTTVRPAAGGRRPRREVPRIDGSACPMYRRAATIRVNTNRRNPGAVVRYIVSQLENPAHRRRPTQDRAEASPPVVASRAGVPDAEPVRGSQHPGQPGGVGPPSRGPS